MKALILAAGLGARLRPLTDKIPKVMVDIGGKPLLWYHVQLLKKHGIKDIWINLHWRPEVIKSYFGNGSKFGIKIKYSFEKKLLGTSGALKNPDSNVEKELRKAPFLVFYGDNLTNINISKMISFHKIRKSFLTVAPYIYEKAWKKGVIEIDTKQQILQFVEKPLKGATKSKLVNSGVYICSNKVFNFVPDDFSDFGFDIFPKLLAAKMPLYTFSPDYYFQDIGTFEGLRKAKKDLKKIDLW